MMAGGRWEKQNKKRPGAYINFESNSLNTQGLDSVGYVAIPLALDWGENKKIIKVTSNTKLQEVFGKSGKDLKPIREAFKATGMILAYNLCAAGDKASASSTDGFKVNARYTGLDGNKIQVTAVVGLKGLVTIKTFFDGAQVDSQLVTTFEDLQENGFVSFEGALPSADVVLTLKDGTTVPATNADYSDFAEALDSQRVKVVAIGTDDETVKSLFTLKIKEWRDKQGKYVTFVTNDYKAADFKGVVSVLKGVYLEGNEFLPAEEALYWYAGAYANATSQSLTHAEYPGAISCESMTDDEIIQALEDGHIVYTMTDEDAVVVEQDINTFRSFTVEQNQDFRKNKIIRAMDVLGNNVKYIYSKYFIGKVINHKDGRDLFKKEIMKTVLDPMVRTGEIEQYVAEDIFIDQGEEKDAVFVEMGITFNDAMEKLYARVNCK